MDGAVVRVFASIASACEEACDALVLAGTRLEDELECSRQQRMEADDHVRALTATVEALMQEKSALEAQLSGEQRECHRLARQVSELQDENMEFKKVSRIVAYDRENSELRRRLDSLTQQPPAAPRQRKARVISNDAQTWTRADILHSDASVQTSEYDVDAVKRLRRETEEDISAIRREQEKEMLLLQKHNEELREELRMLTEAFKGRVKRNPT